MSRAAVSQRRAREGQPPRRRRTLVAWATALALLGGIVPVVATASPPPATTRDATAVGIAPGTIKHVWLIIMENKSYDATFTGLNQNTYLWQQLPRQGVLLKQYYGTGHFSQDNYLSLVSGQAPVTDTQADCPYYDAASGSVDTSGDLSSNPNHGQFVSAAGPNAAAGQNGCVYPASVPTLFNQLDRAGVRWKGYAQDLSSPDPPGQPAHSTGPDHCGAPFTSPGATASTTQANPGAANATDQYVPKHFPFPWFDALLQGGDCDVSHIADLFDPGNGLYHDLQDEASTPAFSWISPNNCSDAHDAVCRGNNLSGGFSDPDTPNPPTNYTGGLYAGDRFLEHVIPEIEASPAFKDGGLIDITFDEAFPPFTYSGNSTANATDVPPNAATSLATDAAGETIDGQPVHSEPAGPNTPLRTAADGDALYPGPGYNSFLDRPLSCVAQTVPAQPADTCLLGGGGHSPGARTDAGATAAAGDTTVVDRAILADDAGRGVSGSGIPAGSFVGRVTDTPVTATAPAQSGGFVDTGSFELVDSADAPVQATGPVSGVTLAAETAQTDPLFTRTGQAVGGGDTGSVLISPYITPGTSSDVLYNHYSWLRTMEDLFGVASTSPGLDGQGHIGYAAQPGLAPFGRDVFSNPPAPGAPTAPVDTTPSPTPPASHPAPAPTKLRLTLTSRRSGRGVLATVKLSHALTRASALRVRVLTAKGHTVLSRRVSVGVGHRTVTLRLQPRRGSLRRGGYRLRAALTTRGGLVVAVQHDLRVR